MGQEGKALETKTLPTIWPNYTFVFLVFYKEPN